MSRNDQIKLMVTIVTRGHSENVIKMFKQEHLGLHYVSLGLGTANSEILDYFGVGETEKEIVFSLVPSVKAAKIMENIKSGMNLRLPGKGIIFILPLTAVNKVVERTLYNDLDPQELEEGEMEEMENQVQFSMVMAIINRGFVDDVMEAAKGAGARGGTVIHARGVGNEEAGKFFGITLQPEKDIVMILVPHKQKVAVMQAITQAAGIRTKAHGILVSLPVEAFGGIS
ncbi:MAG: hypothetical protein PUC32_01260 [Oscillospiraceae bacterium]|nr:hypothetical protein [Oscillospiraceae bacterium]